MDTVIAKLKREAELSTSQIQMLDSICGLNRELIQRQQKVKKELTQLPYSAEMKAFALTLHYYSLKICANQLRLVFTSSGAPKNMVF